MTRRTAICAENGSCFALREYNGHCVLTHKRLGDDNGADLRYKTRIETETGVDECPAMAEVLYPARLWARVSVRKISNGNGMPAEGGHLVLDETPIGTWAELEGDPRVDRQDAGEAGRGSNALHHGQLWRPVSALERTNAQARFENLTFEEVQHVNTGA